MWGRRCWLGTKRRGSIGIEIVDVGAGSAVVRMTVRADMVNGHGVCHGGLIFMLADSALAFACNSGNVNTLAASASIDFVRPARLGTRLLATAIAVHQRGRTGHYDVVVTAETPSDAGRGGRGDRALPRSDERDGRRRDRGSWPKTPVIEDSGVSGRRLDGAAFERSAADKIELAISGADLDAFRASFDAIRFATRLVQRLESTVHRPAGWSMAGFRVMFCVWVAGELEPRDISHFSGLSRAAVSSVLNTLEREGLVERRRESDDRRLVTVRLTASGEQGMLAAYEQQNRVEQDVFGGMSRADLTDPRRPAPSACWPADRASAPRE